MNHNVESDSEFLSAIWGSLFTNTSEAPNGYTLTRLNRMIELLDSAQLDDETFDRVCLAPQIWEPPVKKIPLKEAGVNYLCKTFGLFDSKDVYYPDFAA